MRAISRDVFARKTLYRKQVTITSADGITGYAGRLVSCDNCGHVRQTRKGHPYAYRYGIQQDGLTTRVAWEEHTFCCKSCRDAYNT